MQIHLSSTLLIQDILTSLGLYCLFIVTSFSPRLVSYMLLITLLLRSAHIRYMLLTCYSLYNLILSFGIVSTQSVSFPLLFLAFMISQQNHQ